jgi:hypothetical protein
MDVVARPDAEHCIVGKYLASVAQYGSREAALGTLRRFPLAPSMIEENNDGYIFTYYMWPPSREQVVLSWPETTARGICRSVTNESYTPYDMVRAATMRKWVVEGVMQRPGWHLHAISVNRVRKITWNTGLSPAGMRSVMRWLPLGARGKPKWNQTYPATILWPWDMRDVYVAAIDDPATKRLYANKSTYIDIDEFCSRQTFLPDEMRTTILYTQKRPWVLGRMRLFGVRYMRIDEEKLRAEQEGGNPLRPQR